jgi:hypothetical protein
MNELTVKVCTSERAPPRDPAVLEMMVTLNSMRLRGPWDWIVSIEAMFEDHLVTFKAFLDVPDRYDPTEEKRIMISGTSQLHYKPIAEVARDFLREAVEHELDESIYVDGDRMFDPHLPKIAPDRNTGRVRRKKSADG